MGQITTKFCIDLEEFGNEEFNTIQLWFEKVKSVSKEFKDFFEIEFDANLLTKYYDYEINLSKGDSFYTENNSFIVDTKIFNSESNEIIYYIIIEK